MTKSKEMKFSSFKIFKKDIAWNWTMIIIFHLWISKQEVMVIFYGVIRYLADKIEVIPHIQLKLNVFSIVMHPIWIILSSGFPRHYLGSFDATFDGFTPKQFRLCTSLFLDQIVAENVFSWQSQFNIQYECIENGYHRLYFFHCVWTVFIF